MDESQAVALMLQNQIGIAYGEAARNRAELLTAEARIRTLEAELNRRNEGAEPTPKEAK